MSFSHVGRAPLLSGILLLASGAMLYTGDSPVPDYHISKRITIDSGRATFLAIDAANRHLFGAGNKVIDIDQGTVVGELPLHSGHGFVIIPERGVAISRAGFVFDLITLKTLRQVAVEGASVAYDRLTGRALFVGSSKSDEDPQVFHVGELDVKTDSVLYSGQLAEEPEYVVSDDAGHFFASIAGLHQLVKIDARDPHIMSTWPLGTCRWPHGISIDVDTRRLFVSCYKELAVIDATNGRIVTTIPTGGIETTESAFDRGMRLLFNPNGNGTMTIVHEDSADRFSVVATAQTAEGGPAAVIDEKLHQVFLFKTDGHYTRVLVMKPRNDHKQQP